MSTDVSAFFAFGKICTLDIKLHGIGFLRDKVEFESNCLDSVSLGTTLGEHIVPSVVRLLSKSTDLRVRLLGKVFHEKSDYIAYPRDVILDIAFLVMSLRALNGDEAV